MLKVLLVDDEPLAIEGMKNIIKWEKIGYKICGVAEDGEEAISIIRKTKPDVVVTDIRMPVLDGLELISLVKKRIDSNIKFIILSGYSEFEYAKKAMEFGVKHYLLKPVFEEEMQQVLLELYTEIKKEKESKLQKTEEAHMSISSLIKKLTQKDGSYDELLNIYNSTFNKDAAKVWYYALLRIMPGCADNHEKKDLNAVAEYMRSIANSSIENNKELFVINHNANTFGLFIGIFDDKPNYRHIKNILNEIAEPIKKTYGVEYQISVGTHIKNLKEIKKAYNTSLEALKCSFYSDLNSIVFYHSVKNTNFNYNFLNSEFINSVLQAIEEVDEEKVEKIIQKEFEFFKKKLIDPEIIHIYVNNIIYRSNKMIGNIGEEDELKIDISELENKENSIFQVKKAVIHHCKHCCRVLGKENKKTLDENTHRIEEYIKENYKRSITIKEMSKELYVNPVYLGQLFKKIFGMRFSDYVHQLRIDEAKRLLEETTMEMSEIAREVGYSSYNAFLKYFEKNTGIKPADYKNKI